MRKTGQMVLYLGSRLFDDFKWHIFYFQQKNLLIPSGYHLSFQIRLIFKKQQFLSIRLHYFFKILRFYIRADHDY